MPTTGWPLSAADAAASAPAHRYERLRCSTSQAVFVCCILRLQLLSQQAAVCGLAACPSSRPNRALLSLICCCSRQLNTGATKLRNGRSQYRVVYNSCSWRGAPAASGVVVQVSGPRLAARGPRLLCAGHPGPPGAASSTPAAAEARRQSQAVVEQLSRCNACHGNGCRDLIKAGQAHVG